MIKLIIFDWDDVFTLGSKEGYIQCYHESLRELGVHLDAEEEKKRILERWSEPHQEKFKKLLKERPELIDEACELYEDKLFGETFISNVKFINGGQNLLNNLNRKYSLAVATGANKQILDRVFEKYSVPQVFSKIMYAYEIDDPRLHKPHPYMLNTIMSELHFAPQETVFVGDAASDVQAAQAAHVTPIVVLTGHLNTDQAEKLGVKYIIEDVTKLPQVLDKIASGE